MTPAQRVERARKAALARTTADHYITALTGKTLTDEQRQRLTELLAGNGQPDRVRGDVDA